MEVDQASPSSVDVATLARRIDRPVVLVGMMGAGKSTVGRKLATTLHLPFVDSDDEIELAAHMTIPELFERGEDHFRDGERRVLARLIEGGPRIIATGGGAFCNERTRALILDNAVAVWLDSDLDTLVERVGRRDNRPLLRGGDPRAILARLRDERGPLYAQAQLRVVSDSGPHNRTVGRVVEALAAWL